ncbi:MAG: hypothetical protein FWE50_01735 [Alphaproteobacteria bacterium]|nr:hypothetical protein [Alphaproteobacteria bacterium]
MKKLALTSLVALFAASGAHAANVIDNNPLYRPDAGRFYSITSLNNDTNSHLRAWGIGEEFGYGITDKLAVILNTGVDFAFPKGGDNTFGWNTFGIGLNYRVLDEGNWKADVFGNYQFAPVWDGDGFLKEDNTFYVWTAGVRGGYVAGDWTIAGHVAYDYTNEESFNWGDDGLHQWRLGVDGQYALDSNWNLTAGAEYTGITNDGAKNAGTWNGIFGVNYNIDATKFVGAYIGKELTNTNDGWKEVKGMTWGLKFGIDF